MPEPNPPSRLHANIVRWICDCQFVASAQSEQAIRQARIDHIAWSHYKATADLDDTIVLRVPRPRFDG